MKYLITIFLGLLFAVAGGSAIWLLTDKVSTNNNTGTVAAFFVFIAFIVLVLGFAFRTPKNWNKK